MDLWELKPGDKIRMTDGSVTEVVSGTEDGRWIKVRYLRTAEDQSLVGTEDLCREDEIQGRLATRPETE